ncbi:MAG: DUF559 domain-containing protein [Gammaproteobacteria bacterium]|nr:DUF559 domain-containing protein [Gammaproteobacteria bacterium]
MSETEQQLWKQICSKQILGAQFQRSKTIGPYTVSFYCAEAKLAIDIDDVLQLGAMRSLNDLAKETELKKKGINVLHFRLAELTEGMDVVVAKISDEVRRVLTTTTTRSQRKSESITSSVNSIFHKNRGEAKLIFQIESQLELPL